VLRHEQPVKRKKKERKNTSVYHPPWIFALCCHPSIQHTLRQGYVSELSINTPAATASADLHIVMNAYAE
jgi:hypothetical protein